MSASRPARCNGDRGIGCGPGLPTWAERRRRSCAASRARRQPPTRAAARRRACRRPSGAAPAPPVKLALAVGRRSAARTPASTRRRSRRCSRRRAATATTATRSAKRWPAPTGRSRRPASQLGAQRAGRLLEHRDGSRGRRRPACARTTRSFAAGLLEAATQVRATGRPVLLIAYDPPYPEPLHGVRPMPDAFGVALRAGAAPTRPARSARPRDRTAPTRRRRARHAAAAMPALEALRAADSGRARLPLLRGARAPAESTARCVPRLPADASAAVASAAGCAMSAMLLDRAGIAALIPHAGAMCLLERRDGWDARRASVCSADSHRDAGTSAAHARAACWRRARSNTRRRRWRLHGALIARRRPARAATPGYLASARGVRLHAAAARRPGRRPAQSRPSAWPATTARSSTASRSARTARRSPTAGRRSCSTRRWRRRSGTTRMTPTGKRALVTGGSGAHRRRDRAAARARRLPRDRARQLAASSAAEAARGDDRAAGGTRRGGRVRRDRRARGHARRCERLLDGRPDPGRRQQRRHPRRRGVPRHAARRSGSA